MAAEDCLGRLAFGLAIPVVLSEPSYVLMEMLTDA